MSKKKPIPKKLRQLVRDRASGCCEYCLIPETEALVRHQVDHVIAEKHGGPTTEENLAYCCAVCNQYKGSHIAGIDPLDDKFVPVALFHPRQDSWLLHFALIKARINGQTPNGRATERLLRFNEPLRVEVRRLQLVAGVLRPPPPPPNAPLGTTG